MTRNSSRSAVAVTASARIVANTPRRTRSFSRGRADASTTKAESRRSRSRCAAGGSNVGSPSARPSRWRRCRLRTLRARRSAARYRTRRRRRAGTARPNARREGRACAARPRARRPGHRADTPSARAAARNRTGAARVLAPARASAAPRDTRAPRLAAGAASAARARARGRRSSADARSSSPSNRLQSCVRVAPSRCSTNASCFRRVAASLDSASATTSSRLASRERVAWYTSSGNASRNARPADAAISPARSRGDAPAGAAGYRREEAGRRSRAPDRPQLPRSAKVVRVRGSRAGRTSAPAPGCARAAEDESRTSR